jgi:hypothetical protein
MYQDNDHKTIAVINSNSNLPQLMNALGHSTLGLVSKLTTLEDLQLLTYPFQSTDCVSSQISRYPYIILKAKNNNQLKTLHQAVNELGIIHNAFTDSMLGASAEEQISNTKNTAMDGLTYLSIIMFGKADVLAPLTKKFSLFNG